MCVIELFISKCVGGREEGSQKGTSGGMYTQARLSSKKRFRQTEFFLPHTLLNPFLKVVSPQHLKSLKCGLLVHIFFFRSAGISPTYVHHCIVRVHNDDVRCILPVIETPKEREGISFLVAVC